MCTCFVWVIYSPHLRTSAASYSEFFTEIFSNSLCTRAIVRTKENRKWMAFTSHKKHKMVRVISYIKTATTISQAELFLALCKIATIARCCLFHTTQKIPVIMFGRVLIVLSALVCALAFQSPIVRNVVSRQVNLNQNC